MSVPAFIKKYARLAAAGVLALSVGLGSVAAFSGTAQANAFSCTGYGLLKVPKTGINLARWCGQVYGSGRFVSTVGGGFDGFGVLTYLCNTSLKAEFFDDNGRSVGTYYSAVNRGCWQSFNVYTIYVNRTFATDGYVHIALLSYGAEKAAVEENIKGPAPKPAPKPATPAPKPVADPSHLANTAPAVTPIPLLSPLPALQTPAQAHLPVATPAPTPTPAPAPTPLPTPLPAPRTYAETAGGVAHTWTNYVSAGGSAGPTIAGGQTVQIVCRLTGFRVADGNTWWYRIASSPWNGAYYVSADAFYNNGQTSGSLTGTPFVDPAVPGC